MMIAIVVVGKMVWENLSYGYPDNYEDSRVISASEDGFVSGCEWVLNELENKLKQNN